MRIIIDIRLLIDEKKSIELYFYDKILSIHNVAPDSSSLSYEAIKYTACIAESPWKDGGKELFKVLDSLNKPLVLSKASPAYSFMIELVIYAKCIKQHFDWLSKDYAAWCKRELCTYNYSLLSVKSKRELRPHIKIESYLLTENLNLYRYWKKYSNLCMMCDSLLSDQYQDGERKLEEIESFLREFIDNNGRSSSCYAAATRDTLKLSDEASESHEKRAKIVLDNSDQNEMSNVPSCELLSDYSCRATNIQSSNSSSDSTITLLRIIRNLAALCFGYGPSGAGHIAHLAGTAHYSMRVTMELAADVVSFFDSLLPSSESELFKQIDFAISQPEAVKALTSSKHPASVSIEIKYNIFSLLNLVTSCDQCFAVSAIEYSKSLIACAGDSSSDLPPSVFSVAQVLELIRSEFPDKSKWNSSNPSACTICSARHCPTHSQYMSLVITSLVQQSFSLLVRNYCLHVSPLYVLSSFDIPVISSSGCPLESAFVNITHLCTYQETCGWRDRIQLLARRCAREHKLNLSHQWDMLHSDHSGDEDEDGNFLSRSDYYLHVTSLAGANCFDIGQGASSIRATNRSKGPMMAYCSEDTAVIDLLSEVLSINRTSEVVSDSAGDESDEDDVTLQHFSQLRNNPFSCSVHNFALYFPHESKTAHLSAFIEAGLWHLLPLWPVCSGLMRAVDFLHRRGKWKQKRFSSDNDWKNDFFLCLAIIENVLMFSDRMQMENIPQQICREMLSSLRCACWVRRLSLHEALSGPSSARLQALANMAAEECGTSDSGFSPANIIGLNNILKKYQLKAKKEKQVNRKRKFGKGIARRRLKNAPSDCDEDTTPIKASGEKFSSSSHIARNFTGHFVGKKKGRLLYRRFTALTPSVVSYSAGGRDSMNVEHFALCRYLSLIMKDTHHYGGGSISDMSQTPRSLCSYRKLLNMKTTSNENNSELLPAESALTTVSKREANNNEVNLMFMLPDKDIVDECGQYQMIGRELVNARELNGSDIAAKSDRVERGPGASVHAFLVATCSGSGLNDECANSQIITNDVSDGNENISMMRTEKTAPTANGYATMWLASHCEGSIWLTLLMLFFHEEIMDPAVSLGMMGRPFLSRPVDLMPECHSEQPLGSPISCNYFYFRRKGAIQRKIAFLKNLSDRDVAQELYLLIDKCQGRHFYGVNWDRVDPFLVVSAGWCLGGLRISVVLEEMLLHPVCYFRGMPDLLFCQALPQGEIEVRNNDTCFLRFLELQGSYGEAERSRASTPASRACHCHCHCCPWNSRSEEVSKCFVSEVKSTSDRLSVWQQAWFDLFHKAGIPYEEAHVNWKL